MMDGSRIAQNDIAQISKLANIDALEKEMIHKAKTLKTQISTNPGLKPVFKQYMAHIRARRADIIGLVHYMSSLLISLNSITLPENDDGAKLQSDQNVVVFEIDRLNKLLSELNTVEDVDDDDTSDDDSDRQ